MSRRPGRNAAMGMGQQVQLYTLRLIRNWSIADLAQMIAGIA
ncbi:MAG: hypothetical protein GPOALKHO_001199 [Sodalis sp.]|nr:MAG: hypothetical protein GPOALKHO_001199 [Sodalis sp.]